MGAEDAVLMVVRDMFQDETIVDELRRAIRAKVHALLPYQRFSLGEDAIEEVFNRTALEALKGATSFDQEKEPVPWLCGIARNVVRDHCKDCRQHDSGATVRVPLDKGRGEARPDRRRNGSWGTVRVPFDEAIVLDVEDVLATLPGRQGEALRQTHIEGRTIGEVTASMRLKSENAARQLLHRAKKSFKLKWVG